MVNSGSHAAEGRSQSRGSRGCPDQANFSALDASRKRKRDGDASQLSPRKRPFVIRPCLSAPFDHPRNLVPVELVPRSRLPLVFLDPVGSLPQLPASRLFSGFIDGLETSDEGKGKRCKAPMVLVAKSDTDASLYAVERVRRGAYALCKLSSWVTVADIRSMASHQSDVAMGVLAQSFPEHIVQKETVVKGLLHSKGMEIPLGNPGHPGNPRIPRISMMRPPRTTNHGIATPPKEDESDITRPSEAICAADAQLTLSEILEQPPTAQQVYETLISQYLHSIYLSKTSLAYFAKGPLSRARAAFSTENDNMLLSDLIVFLRSMLLGPSVLDKKYRETLPNLVKDVSLTGLSDREHNEVGGPKSQKKKRRITQWKVRRDGTYPIEREHIEKWWLSEFCATAVGFEHESSNDILKRKAADLKIRETMAQLIIILEVLSLERSLSSQPAKEEKNPKLNGGTEQLVSNMKKKHRKSQDIGLLIDLTVDKLCIWQSVEQENGNTPYSGGVDADSVTSNALHRNDGKPADADMLKGFCTEVIIPFYMHRIPEQAAMLNRKLGGPTAPSPAKRAIAKGSASSSKPIERDSKKGRTKQPRKPLQRILTDTNIQAAKRIPSLARSLTDSRVIELKREVSEVPLAEIPVRRSPSISLSRSGVSQYKHLSQREVDFSALSTAKDAPSRKKATIKEQLRDAITALKKPNRGLAVKEYVDSTEQRTQLAAQKSKKPANAPRRPLQSVQVTATPKRHSKSLGIKITPLKPGSVSLEHDERILPPPSSETCIPASAVRPSTSEFIIPGSVIRRQVPGKENIRHDDILGVQQTPLRGPNQQKLSLGRLDRDGTMANGTVTTEPVPGRLEFLCPSPYDTVRKKKSFAVQLTPTRPKESRPLFSTDCKAVPVTPVKSKGGSIRDECGILTESSSRGNARDTVRLKPEKSIYDVLGWNDDVDELA